jgi:hypothetical protein
VNDYDVIIIGTGAGGVATTLPGQQPLPRQRVSTATEPSVVRA